MNQEKSSGIFTNEDGMWRNDCNGVQFANTRFDKLLARNPYQYMRLHGTEKSFFKLEGVKMYQKDLDGKYELLYEEGALVLTTRRLTFSTLSKRASATTRFYVPIIGRYTYFHKERDLIRFSIPIFLLYKNYIKGDIDCGHSITGMSKKPFEWCIEEEGVVFVFSIPRNLIDLFRGLQEYFGIDAEGLMCTMKYKFEDTDLLPGWEFERTKEGFPDENTLYSIDERTDFVKDLLIYYKYYYFFGESQSQEDVERYIKSQKTYFGDKLLIQPDNEPQNIIDNYYNITGKKRDNNTIKAMESSNILSSNMSSIYKKKLTFSKEKREIAIDFCLSITNEDDKYEDKFAKSLLLAGFEESIFPEEDIIALLEGKQDIKDYLLYTINGFWEYEGVNEMEWGKSKELFDGDINLIEEAIDWVDIYRIWSLLLNKLGYGMKDKDDKKIENNKLSISSFSEELEKLASLKEKGILTEEEFSAAKAKLLS